MQGEEGGLPFFVDRVELPAKCFSKTYIALAVSQAPANTARVLDARLTPSPVLMRELITIITHLRIRICSMVLVTEALMAVP